MGHYFLDTQYMYIVYFFQRSAAQYFEYVEFSHQLGRVMFLVGPVVLKLHGYPRTRCARLKERKNIKYAIAVDIKKLIKKDVIIDFTENVTIYYNYHGWTRETSNS